MKTGLVLDVNPANPNNCTVPLNLRSWQSCLLVGKNLYLQVPNAGGLKGLAGH